MQYYINTIYLSIFLFIIIHPNFCYNLLFLVSNLVIIVIPNGLALSISMSASHPSSKVTYFSTSCAGSKAGLVDINSSKCGRSNALKPWDPTNSISFPATSVIGIFVAPKGRPTWTMRPLGLVA
mmetsp:Transcript_30477/g.73114  ORF Transcript_30477/g.73114 Transcript_30477/m.73114 type:complete len:124 (+) Transcript_30477:645-1016(+)